jgi:hypothetical protein
VRDLVTGEVAGYLAARMVKSVAPTVAALRSRAAAVVAGEMERLDHRLPDLDEATRQEFQHAVHRVVEKLLHTPTVRIKELSSDGHGEDYAAALRELFDLDPHTVAAVSTAADSGAPRAGRCVMTTLRLGTRRSTLALAQATEVADRLGALGHDVDLVPLTTLGDQSSHALTTIGGTGVFAAAIRRALLDGEIDLAVHSLKDLPTAPEPGLVVAATPTREDPRDVLVARDGLTLGELPAGSVVGTGSPRRAAQLGPSVSASTWSRSAATSTPAWTSFGPAPSTP